ncbi:cytospin-A isoform X2 [Neoarius graeffei]|uniref:cytospin-A isoform X2 n=1 Tax=Neoarius graeffei TaxID=443677 RepID=UPI00298CCB67|nr:cytospin-A isoform X2 [Neoarius graeffei]
MGNYPGKERHASTSAGTADTFQTPPTSPSSPLSPVSPGNAQRLSSPTHPDPNTSPERTPSPITTGPDGCLSSEGVENNKAPVSAQKADDGPLLPWKRRQNSTSASPVQVEPPLSGQACEGWVEQELLDECVVSLGFCEKTHTLSDLLQCFLTERAQMKDELKSLKEKMQTERSEWLQFQSDLQVALVVADRLRAEAEEELRAHQEAREDWERQLTEFQQGQREVEGQVERLKAELQQSKQRLSQRTETPSQQGATEGCSVERWGDEQRTGEEKQKEKDAETTEKLKPQEDFSKLLRRHGGSKRNSLLRWSQNRTSGYKNIEITNFSSSWMDGLAFCAVYHSYLPSHIPYSTLRPENKKENLLLAFQTGESVGIAASLTADEMLKNEGPDWQRVLGYVESIYRHFEM